MTTEVDPIPTPETLSKAGSGELYDIEGNRTTFSEITKDHRVLIIFIRHFWCGICQGYVKQLSEYLPPTSLPADTKVVIIGCGSYEPIQWYQDLTQSQYPIYANPSLSLYQDFEFQSRLAVAKKGEEREYDKVLGSTFTKVWNAIKIGPMQNFGQRNQVGPKSQNGGEVVLQKDGTCTFFHRMQHTADHLDIKDVAEAIGVKIDSTSPLNGTGEGVLCEAGARQP